VALQRKVLPVRPGGLARQNIEAKGFRVLDETDELEL
jgi:hypothetical protein